jgi:hypothetical protein
VALTQHKVGKCQAMKMVSQLSLLSAIKRIEAAVQLPIPASVYYCPRDREDLTGEVFDPRNAPGSEWHQRRVMWGNTKSFTWRFSILADRRCDACIS